MGPLEAVAAAVAVEPGAPPERLAELIRPPGAMTAARVREAASVLAMLGVLAPSGRGWAPGPVALADLPLPVDELERAYRRGASSRARGRAASRARGW